MTTLFFSYSHVDEDLRDTLETHLAAMKHQGLIETWHDRRIPAGDVLDRAVERNLEEADIILLLVSADFIASEYCYGIEMERAMERHAAGEARVVPVILRDCDWENTPFGKLLAVPKDGKPVRSWPDLDKAFHDVVKSLKKIIKERSGPVEASAEPSAAQPVPDTPPQAGSRSSVHPWAEWFLFPDTPPQAGSRSSNLLTRKRFSEADRDTSVSWRSTMSEICTDSRGDKWEIYKDGRGEWRWRRTARNGEQVGKSGEGYKNKADCIANAQRHGMDCTPS